MKKSLLSAFAIASFTIANAQTQRICLFEEWTGENCPPCASVNPSITSLANANYSNPKKLILLRYQVPIPSAPTSPTSLYQQNTTEPTARQTYYYPVSSDKFAPQGRLNGHELGRGDANGSNGHAGFLAQDSIDLEYLVDAPFSLSTGFAWNATFDSVTITTTITAAQDFSTANPLKLHLAITEEHITYASAPGTNGEKEFEYIMRKMVPSQTGQTLSGSWTNGQTQTIVNKVKLPTYIWNKGEVTIVGFIQEDVPIPTGQGPNTTRTIHQSAYGSPQPLALDANVDGILGISASNCNPNFTPAITLKNNGVTSLDSCRINYKIDNGAVQTYYWYGNLTSGLTTLVVLPSLIATAGTHTFTAYTSNPNGATDNNSANDSKNQTFIVFGNTQVAPISQAFTTTGIPTGFNVGNPDGGYTWQRVTTMGGCLKYDAYNNGNEGDIDYLYLPRLDFTGLTAMELRFDVSHKNYNNTYIEQLLVEVSTDCGSTWNTVYDKSGTTLATAGASTSAFTPTTASQWRNETVSLGSYDGNQDVLVAFKLVNGYGNNLYLDNINVLSNPIGIKENELFSSVNVYPNPSSDKTNITVNSNINEDVTIAVYNTIGQLVKSINSKFAQGENKIELNTADFANGIYNIEFQSKSGKLVQKLTVSH
jgi:hypothetical protein